MKKSTMILLGVVAFIVIIISMLGGSYNSLVEKSENVDKQLANVDVQLERRTDLIPNLVSTVKGYTSHETEIIDKITSARENLLKANTVTEKSNANDELTSALNALMVVVENYPDLKSNQNFIQLSDELAGTENRIATSRRDYNDAVTSYNTSIKKFPTNILAGMFGFNKKDYFEVSEGKTDVPKVEF
ncbi:MAG: LemA family protein [Tenericutes bacterium]|nr:LemA family protein [Mycoplasmatota bacterium]